MRLQHFLRCVNSHDLAEVFGFYQVHTIGGLARPPVCPLCCSFYNAQLHAPGQQVGLAANDGDDRRTLGTIFIDRGSNHQEDKRYGYGEVFVNDPDSGEWKCSLGFKSVPGACI